MQNTTVEGWVQTSLDDLLRALKERPGAAMPYGFPPDHVGGELLSILSKGLYPTPLDCIREYVQNAVNAGAGAVTIKVTGNSVIIHDNGSGMGLTELEAARSFGISPKSIAENVGFRGIGIYSGFDISHRLVITTKRADEPNVYTLEFDFGVMRQQLDQERREAAPVRTPLTKLISDHSRFSWEAEEGDRQYTIVQLEELSKTHLDQIADRAALRKYVLKNLPIDFDDGWEHKARVSKALHAHVPGYNAVVIRLEAGAGEREVICKPNIANLAEPKYGFIYNDAKTPIAFYWACLHMGGAQIPQQYSDHRGFVYRVKGFTIGDNRQLLPAFKVGSSTLYWWYTGEIYVLDHNVIPNAARDAFEMTPERLQLDKAVTDQLRQLDREASDYQKKTLAEKKVKEAVDALRDIQAEVDSGRYDPLAVYRRLQDQIDDLKSRRKAQDKKLVADLIDQAQRLSKLVSSKINNPEEVTKRPPRPGRAGEPTPPPPASFPDGAGSLTPPARLAPNGVIAPERAARTTPEPGKTLLGLIEQAGWDLAKDPVRIVQHIDGALADVLGQDSVSYQRVMAEVEAKLQEEDSF